MDLTFEKSAFFLLFIPPLKKFGWGFLYLLSCDHCDLNNLKNLKNSDFCRSKITRDRRMDRQMDWQNDGRTDGRMDGHDLLYL